MTELKSGADPRVTSLRDRVNAYGLRLEEIIKIVPGIEHRFVLEKKGNTLYVDFAFKDTLNKRPSSKVKTQILSAN